MRRSSPQHGSRADFEQIVDSVRSDPQFADLEIVKSGVRTERGAYVMTVVVDREGGVDTDLCERISRYLARRADALPEPVPDYQVEVSSAGLDRPLVTPDNFRRFIGRPARVITTLRIGNRTEFGGRIEAADRDAVTIADPHAGVTPIPYAAIKRAHLVYDPAQDLKKKRAD